MLVELLPSSSMKPRSSLISLSFSPTTLVRMPSFFSRRRLFSANSLESMSRYWIAKLSLSSSSLECSTIILMAFSFCSMIYKSSSHFRSNSYSISPICFLSLYTSRYSSSFRIDSIRYHFSCSSYPLIWCPRSWLSTKNLLIY